jgi:hypothetical protein
LRKHDAHISLHGCQGAAPLLPQGGIHHWRMPEVLHRYNSLSWIRYPLALRVRRRVPVSSSGIISSCRYLAIGYSQSTSGLGGPTMATNFFACTRYGAVGPTGASRLTPDIGDGQPSPDRGPGMETGTPSSRGAPGARVGASSSSRTEGWKDPA